MLHSEVIFKSMTGPDDTRVVDLQAWMYRRHTLHSFLLKAMGSSPASKACEEVENNFNCIH